VQAFDRDGKKMNFSLSIFSNTQQHDIASLHLNKELKSDWRRAQKEREKVERHCFSMTRDHWASHITFVIVFVRAGAFHEVLLHV
jgi:hypothetical protein